MVDNSDGSFFDAGSVQDPTALLNALGAQIPGIIWQCLRDPDGRISYPYFYDGIKCHCGLRPDQRVDNLLLIWNCILLEDEPKFREALNQSLEYAENLDIDFRINDPSGNLRWLKTSAVAFIDAQGRTILNGVSLDITQQKKYEEELRYSQASLERRIEERTKELREEVADHREAQKLAQESEKRYHDLIEFSVDAILHARPDGRLVGANRKARELFGYTQKQLLSMNMTDLHPDEGREKAVGGFQRIIETGELDAEEFMIRNVDGDAIPVEIKARLIEVLGQPLLQGIFRDIRERKKQQKREKRHRDTIDLLNGIAAFANESKSSTEAMRLCVQSICEHSHWPIGHVYVRDQNSQSRLIPSNIWLLNDPVKFAAWDKITRETVFEGNAGLPGRVAESREPLWVTDIGNKNWFLRAAQARELGIETGFAIPIIVDSEVPAVLEFFSTDRIEPDDMLLRSLSHVGVQLGRVFERERTAQKLELAKRLAEAANQTKSDFLAGISHELRTPLNAIIGFSGIIRNEVFGSISNSKYAEYIDDIHGSGQFLLDLINDLLDLSAIEAHKLDLHETPVQVTEIAESAIQLVKLRAKKKNIVVEYSAKGEFPVIQADERRLKQVILNLLSNAVKYTPDNGSVSLTLTLSGTDVMEITISDTGVGMDTEDVEKALAEFMKVDNMMTKSEEGTGLGLPLTKGLLDLMGGSMEIVSSLGSGTTVVVRLPFKPVGDNPDAPG